MFGHLGHSRLACLPLLRLVGQRLCLRFVARLRFGPLLPPLRLLGLLRLAPLRLGFRPLRQLGFQLPPQRR